MTIALTNRRGAVPGHVLSRWEGTFGGFKCCNWPPGSGLMESQVSAGVFPSSRLFTEGPAPSGDTLKCCCYYNGVCHSTQRHRRYFGAGPGSLAVRSQQTSNALAQTRSNYPPRDGCVDAIPLNTKDAYQVTVTMISMSQQPFPQRLVFVLGSASDSQLGSHCILI